MRILWVIWWHAFKTRGLLKKQDDASLWRKGEPQIILQSRATQVYVSARRQEKTYVQRYVLTWSMEPCQILSVEGEQDALPGLKRLQVGSKISAKRGLWIGVSIKQAQVPRDRTQQVI